MLDTVAVGLVDELSFEGFYEFLDELFIVPGNQPYFVHNRECGQDGRFDLIKPYFFSS